jgi:hypothetical protein
MSSPPGISYPVFGIRTVGTSWLLARRGQESLRQTQVAAYDRLVTWVAGADVRQQRYVSVEPGRGITLMRRR